MSMKDSADGTLIENTLKGDERSFAELVRRYQAAVWGTVYRILGNSSENEDAVQEVFLRAYTALHKFDLKYPFGPWILRITTNYCIDQLRKRRGRKLQLWSELTEFDQRRLLNNLSRDSDLDSISMESSEGYTRASASIAGWFESQIPGSFCSEGSGGKELRRSRAGVGNFRSGCTRAGFKSPIRASEKISRLSVRA